MRKAALTRMRRRDREQTITDLLDAAEALFAEKGPDGFGLAELGRRAGLSFGLIHHYFGGKTGLLRAVLRRTLREMGREIRRLQEDGSFWRRDAPAVLLVFDTFSARPGFSRLLAWGLLTDLIESGDIATEFQSERKAVAEMVEAFHEDKPQTSAQEAAALATLLVSTVLGFNLLRPLLASAFAWNGAQDELVRAQLVRAMTDLASSR